MSTARLTDSCGGNATLRSTEPFPKPLVDIAVLNSVPTNVQQIKDQMKMVFQMKGLRRSVSCENLSQLNIRNLLKGAVNVIQTREDDLLHSVAIGQKLLKKLNGSGGSGNFSSSNSPSSIVARAMSTGLSPASSAGSPSEKENDTYVPKVPIGPSRPSSGSRDKVDSALISAQRSIVTSKTEKVNLVAHLEELQAQLTETQDVLQCRELRIAALVESLQKYRKEVDQLNSEVDTLRSENMSLQIRVKQLTLLKLPQHQLADESSDGFRFGRYPRKDLHSLVDNCSDVETPPRTLLFSSQSGTPLEPGEFQLQTIACPSLRLLTLQQSKRMASSLKSEFASFKQIISSCLLDTQRQLQESCKTIELEMEQASECNAQLKQKQLRFSIQDHSPEAVSDQSTPNSELSPLAFAEHCHKMAVAAAVEEELARRLSRVMATLQTAETQLCELSTQLKRARWDRNRAFGHIHAIVAYYGTFWESLGNTYIELMFQQKQEILELYQLKFG